MIRCPARAAASAILLAAFCLAAASAAESPSAPKADTLAPYAAASADCRSALEKAVALVSQGKWRSAYAALDAFDPDGSDPFDLAMKTEVVLRGELRSDRHRAFALADLREGESLDSLRRGAGDYALIPFDPPAIAASQAAKGAQAPGILSKELGDYYAEVLARFSGQWAISDEEILARLAEEYAAAFAAGVYDGASLLSYAEALVRLKRADESVPVYEKAVELDPANAALRYSYAMSLASRGEKAEALSQAGEAIAASGAASGDASEKLRAISLGARLALELGEAERAEGYFALVDKDYPGNPAADLLRHLVYIEAGKGDAAQAVADALVASYGSSASAPIVVQTLVSAWFSSGEAAAARAFLERNIAKGGDDLIVGTLHFYLAVLLTQDSPSARDKTLALRSLDEAEARLKLAYGEDNDVFNVIAGMRDALKED
jgi:tetratricopeptide (TPR) repeat protein